ncbi:MaoC family dehydratase [Pseudomonas sp. 25 R 14]|uniref:MaoC family dehydratase n=1 Tax=Pseudomonas sp. 25 R 14 TaxID=1844109 RepID=UPI00081209E0|nr:MaoC family dehydratase [Pseudomonas sp. 25 R 14]CRM75492.1 (3R)-hydroxyacyl-ACP dehydratase subunit HadB [Pseudomonas sp. 25 R 14]
MSQIKVGSLVPALTLPPVSRHTLALYCGASGDHNPIHVDSDFARKAGMPDVFAHGMLSMAYLGRMLTDWQPQMKLRTFTTRFTALTQVHDVITCTGKVVEILEEQGVQLVRLEIAATTATGTQTLIGEAMVAL